MRWGIMIGIAVVLVFVLAPVVPIVVSQTRVLPWAGQCMPTDITPSIVPPSGRVFASPLYFASNLLAKDSLIAHGVGLVVVPWSSEPVQFPPIGYPTRCESA